MSKSIVMSAAGLALVAACAGLPAQQVASTTAPHAMASAQTHALKQNLPDAPNAARSSIPGQGLIAQAIAAPAVQTPPVPSDAQAPPNGPRLTLIEAEQLAIKNNPRVSIGKLLALAQHQVARETRSAELPTATADLTAADAQDGSRISAGSLTASRLFEHAGAGGRFSQLITDFGKTSNLVASSMLQEKAQNADALATTEDIVMATDQAFYDALQAQALLRGGPAECECTPDDGYTGWRANQKQAQIHIGLELRGCELVAGKAVALGRAGQCRLHHGRSGCRPGPQQASHLPSRRQRSPLSSPPPDVAQLTQVAMQQRPDLQALNFRQQSAVKYSHAQRDQMLPSISAAATVGSVPIRPSEYYTSNWWGAVGVNMSIPIFNGFLYSAQAKEASIRAQAASEQSRDLRDRIVRDVRTAWLAANTAYQRVTVTAALLQQANLALNLAQTRYRLGLSSIVELSQAQYQQTDAAIGNTDAQYQYRLSLASLNYQIGGTP